MAAVLGDEPTLVVCPQCRFHVYTAVDHLTTMTTHMLVLITSLIIYPFALCFYHADFTKDVAHTCPHCKYYIGTYIRD